MLTHLRNDEWEEFGGDQDTLSSSIVLISSLIDSVLTWQGEMTLWSLFITKTKYSNC